MKRWIVLTMLTAACVPIPYFGGIATQVAQSVQAQEREEQRQQQQRAAEQQWAKDRAHWLAVQRQQQQAEAAQRQQAEAAQRQWEATQQERAARLRWEEAQRQQAEEERKAWQAAQQSTVPRPVEQSAGAESNTVSILDSQLLPPDVESAPTHAAASLAAPPDSSAIPPLPIDAREPPVSSASPVARQQEPAPRPLRRTEKRKPKPPARRYEVYQALMCNDGTESPTCSCGGSHRGCCSHHGGVSGCSTRRIPLDQ